METIWINIDKIFLTVLFLSPNYLTNVIDMIMKMSTGFYKFIKISGTQSANADEKSV